MVSRPLRISIHALLAESDGTSVFRGWTLFVFLSTLSLRRATRGRFFYFIPSSDFYPRSPCGERLDKVPNQCKIDQFLSTLSLRRATAPSPPRQEFYNNFYPRSPCGERHTASATRLPSSQFLSTLSLRRATVNVQLHWLFLRISIHALLAESDLGSYSSVRHKKISIHALLAESDVLLFQLFCAFFDFYPRSPCGERPILGIPNQVGTWISIHALLAESDTLAAPSYMSREISIHALLAESDS